MQKLRLRPTCIPGQPVQREFRWFDHTFAHTALCVVLAGWGPAEDVGNHNQGRLGAPLRTPSLRLRTMEQRLGESLA